MQLGILDFCCIRKGHSPTERVFETLQMVQEAETLGYSRYWLSEHHELSYAHHSPELLMGMMAGSTERIRVGVAGVLLLLHSPLRVAKTFRLLEALFGGRVDLGVGSGSSLPEVLAAMRSGAPLIGNNNEDYLQRVEQLLALMRNESSLSFNPMDAGMTPLWLLGSGSPVTASLAARHGTSYGLSLSHAKSRDDPSLIARYREEFRPSSHQSAPRCIVSVAALCAETDEEARRQAENSPENPRSGFEVVGSPQHCRERLLALAERYQIDELILLNMGPDQATQLRSLQLLAEALALPATASAA
ncbi:MsnO8 family LLM class oxidoreductase [Hyalangium sp.]|uniref:MsnO8 family LLM class oxidoreductase n=1 Tax=Hyalangium sp. TaxID=2028555 RepID=UPI002D2EBB21|nr:MsnO8 family LLM class oxidoreductase [Hyalangium sp.]HYH97802.1 MsnO8 family LLM class oxidoreductase [Hyalangium sp.]